MRPGASPLHGRAFSPNLRHCRIELACTLRREEVFSRLKTDAVEIRVLHAAFAKILDDLAVLTDCVSLGRMGTVGIP